MIWILSVLINDFRYVYIYIYMYILVSKTYSTMPIMHITMYRRFRGDKKACPPTVTGKSASFRLRFRFVRAVRAVRAGEAKLRGRT